MRLIPVKDREVLRQHGIWFSPHTLRWWHSRGINREIFIKLNNRLFVDLDKWEEMVKKEVAGENK